MTQPTRESLIETIRQLGPWHHNIRLTDELEIMDAYDESERQRTNNQNISLINSRGSFAHKAGLIYPQGLDGKRFLDCACNAGGYCFWAAEMGAQQVFGFDVREHWIQQARFVQQHRTVAPVENIQFETCDLMKLPGQNLPPADFTLFKGIFYHLADPILGLKIAADLTREVLWLNTARCFIDNTESLYCTFEARQNLMSGVHALSWIPSGPSVVAKMLYWLGFRDIRHVFSKRYDDRPKFGRMELIAAREPGLLQRLAEAENAETLDIAAFKNSQQAQRRYQGVVLIDPQVASRRLLLLGPQPQYAGLRESVQRLNPDGGMALITAGWEEEELAPDRLQPLLSALPAGTLNLELFRRSEDLFLADQELIDLLRERQDKLRHLRDLYCLRLDDLLDSARHTLRRHDPLLDLQPEIQSSIRMLRELDREYLLRTREVCAEYDRQLKIAQRPFVIRHRRELTATLRQARAIVIGGGHTAIILNRLRIFGVLQAAPQLPIVAWSGGAMALGEQIVLFHDSPPQGRGNAEVMRDGMAVYDDLLPLPDARNRLLLQDSYRVQLFCRRFDRCPCIVFDEQTLLDRADGVWWSHASTRRMSADGQLVPMHGELAR